MHWALLAFTGTPKCPSCSCLQCKNMLRKLWKADALPRLPHTHKLSGLPNIWGKSYLPVKLDHRLQSRFRRVSKKLKLRQFVELDDRIKHTELDSVWFIWFIANIYYKVEKQSENFEVPSLMVWFPSSTELSHICHTAPPQGWQPQGTQL